MHNVIIKEKCIPYLLKITPDFSHAWQDHLKYWEGENTSIWLDIGAFSDYVIDAIIKMDDDQKTKLFNAVEELLIYGDDDVQNAIATCFLENIVNASGETISSDVFVSFLGTSSREHCRAWDEYHGIRETFF